VEQCSGHQCWRGTTGTCVSSNIEYLSKDQEDLQCHLVEGRPMELEYSLHHRGLRAPGAGAMRNTLSRNIEKPAYIHFGFDPAGTKFVSDWCLGGDAHRHAANDRLVIGRAGLEPDAALTQKVLCNPQALFMQGQDSHAHPALSPDARTVIFNTATPGKPPQACVAHVTDDMF